MSETTAIPNRAKKGVGLSGVTAGNTALCTVGRSGNDLHYRGYDILDVAEQLRVRGDRLSAGARHAADASPSWPATRRSCSALRGLPAAVKRALEALPAASHPMDVMRTGVSALGCVLPEKDDQNQPGARDIADRLMACLGSMLLYWFHYAHNGKRIDVETDDDSIGGHFLHLLHGKPPPEMFVRAMHTSLILYAEHEFNASTFTCRVVAGTGADMYSAITAGIGALRGPKHGGANEVSFEIQNRYATPDEAEADIRKRIAQREVVIGFGHAVYTIADPRNKVIKEVARRLSKAGGLDEAVRHRRPHRGDDGDAKKMFANLDWFSADQLPHARRADRDVYAAVRDRAHLRLGRACDRTAHRQQADPADGELCRAGVPGVRAAQGAALSSSRAVHRADRADRAVHRRGPCARRPRARRSRTSHFN